MTTTTPHPDLVPVDDGTSWPRTAADPRPADRHASARRVSLHPPRPTVPHLDPLGLPTLVAIAEGLASVDALWRPHVSHDPLSRTSVRLVATDAYEVWLLGWTQGQRVEFHDHGGANAAFVVLEGELDELTLTGDGVRTVRHRPGTVATVAATAIHDVVNPEGRPATSLHVYADPLERMTFYGPTGEALRTELVEPVPAVVDGSAAARPLHPSAGR